MEQKPELNPERLKKFVKHLCIVAKHYRERQDAKLELGRHIEKIRKSAGKENISILSEKIDSLLEKQAKLAELGLRKKAPPAILSKIQVLESQLASVKAERDRLAFENHELRQAIDSIASKNENLIGELSSDEVIRLKTIEADIEGRYNSFLISELAQKISILEKNYAKLSKEKGIDKKRLKNIAQKLKKYKEKISQINS
jgi:hypothetical protein